MYLNELLRAVLAAYACAASGISPDSERLA